MTTLSLRDLGFIGGLGGGDSDPYFANVSLLLHGNGGNGSTVITDFSGSPKTLAAAGNAQISTAQSKFGGSSIAFDGVGDAVSITPLPSFNFGGSSFTIEFWIYPIAWTSFPAFIMFMSGAVNIDVVTTTLRATVTGGPGLAATAPSFNSWSHIALVRNGNNFALYINGSSVASETSSVTLVQPSQFTLNRSGFESQIYLDEVRITNGVARYTASFTPPTAPFPDF
jgi:hypothetical protein